MKNIKTFLCALLLSLTLAFPASAAETPQSFKIAVIDMPYVMQQSTAGKSVRQQLDSQREKYLKQVKKKEDELLSVEEELKRQRGVMDAKAFEEKRAGFEKQISAAQAEAQKLKGSLDKAYSEAITKLRNETAKIVADVAKEQGVAVVLSRQSVVLAEKTLDITPQVTERLNKSIKDIPVSW